MQTAKQRTPLLALVLALGIHIDAGAIASLGTRSCGDWVKNVQEKGILEAAQKNWLTGFLTGLAFGTDKDVLKGASGESLFLWVTNYCNRNPLEDSFDAGIELFLELKKKIK